MVVFELASILTAFPSFLMSFILSSASVVSLK